MKPSEGFAGGSFTAVQRQFMARALELAMRGLYTTTPNPRVGCVLVQGGQIVGEGWHEHAGEPHAEVLALRVAGGRARGSTAFVTLEPCAHHGRTPPCTQALVAAGVSAVVAAVSDPDPRVAGAGLSALAGAGLAVRCGLLDQEARELNLGFFSRLERGRPWLRMKVAASLDGRTALESGESRWITGPEARRDGHHFRARSCAVLIGIGTLLKDDPRLTVRDVPTPRQPLRVVVDRHLQIPLEAQILAGGNVLVVTALGQPDREAQLRARGAEILHLPDGKRRVDLGALMEELGRRGVNEVLAESGNRLNGALMDAGVVDELLVYLAPHLLGDTARGMFGLQPLQHLAQRPEFVFTEITRVGDDLRILARPKR